MTTLLFFSFMLIGSGLAEEGAQVYFGREKPSNDICFTKEVQILFNKANIVLFLRPLGAVWDEQASQTYSERSLLDLARMGTIALESTDCKQFPLRYGCYCGPSGNDTTLEAIDEMDQICKEHDICYINYENQFNLNSYTTLYNFKVVDGEITCVDPEGTPERFLCSCDKTVVESFINYFKEKTCYDKTKDYKDCPY